MTPIKGYIRNRKTFNQYEADLLIQSGYWIIRYKDGDGHIQQITWDENQVKQRKEIGEQHQFYTEHDADRFFLSTDAYLLKRLDPKNPIQKWVYKNPAIPTIATGLLFLALAIGIVYISLPFISSKIAGTISIETEKKLGRKMADAFLENENIDDTLSMLLNDYYQALNKKSQYEIKIHAINSDMVNAFAIPGGTIAVYRGILEKMKTHEALAALLGHESTHIEHRHSLKSITRDLALGTTVNLLLGGYDITSVLVSNATKLNGLKYSRSLEEDADNGSVNFLMEKNISLQGMVDLMEALESAHAGGATLEILQTHPLTDKRLLNAKEELANQKQIDKHPALEEIWNKIKTRLSDEKN